MLFVVLKWLSISYHDIKRNLTLLKAFGENPKYSH